MTFSRSTHAAEDAAPHDVCAARTGAPVRTAAARLPAIDAGPILMRNAHSRRAIPGFDGDDDGAPFDISDLIRQVEDASEAASRAWPGLARAPEPRGHGPAVRVDDAGRARAERRDEFAALQEIKQKQAAALRQARDEIVSLDDTVKLLRAKLTQQEKETAAANNALLRADEDKTALRAELEQGNVNFAELLRQTADLNASFNEKEKEIAAMRRTVAALKGELAAKAGEGDLTAAIEEAKARYYRDFNKRYAQFEAQLEKLAHMVGARDERIAGLEEENARIAARCDALAAKAATLDNAHKEAQAQLKSQTAAVTFLDAALQTEREATGQRIAELTADLRRERMERAAEAREAAVVCKEIAQVLPRLARPSARVMDAMERAAGDGA